MVSIMFEPEKSPACSNRPTCGRGVTMSMSALVMVAALAAMTGGCGQANVYHEPPPPDVVVTRPVRQGVTSYLEYTGTAQASETVVLRARVRGFLKQRLFRDGDDVKAGQLLFVIDEEPFQVRLEQARARQGEAEAALKKAEESKAREVASAQLALDLSQLDLSRLEESRTRTLVGRNASSREDLDRKPRRLARRPRPRSSPTAPSLEQAEVDYETSILVRQVDPRRRPSPKSGTPRSTWAIAGSHRRSTAGSTAASSTWATTSAKARPPSWRRSSRPTRSAPTSTSARGTCSACNRWSAWGGRRTIARPGSRWRWASATSKDTRTWGWSITPTRASTPGPARSACRGIFPNPDRRDRAGPLRPGPAPVRSPRERPARPRPAPSARTRAGQYLLVVGKDDNVERRQVKPGTEVGAMRVVDGEIGPDDRVVVDGLLRARPGLKVDPEVRGSGRRPSPRRHRPPRCHPAPEADRASESRSMFSKFFIERPIFANVIAIVTMLVGGVTLFGLPIEQYPADHAADRPGHHELPRRQRPGPLRHRRLPDRAGGQRRRGDALHVLDLLERRLVHADGHLRGRHRPRQGPGPGPEPRGDRAAEAAAGGAAAGDHQPRSSRPTSSWWSALTSPDGRYDGLFLSNFATLRSQGCAQPDHGRRRHPGLRRRQLRDADLARPREAQGPQPDDRGRAGRDRASRMSRSPPARSGNLPRRATRASSTPSPPWAA